MFVFIESLGGWPCVRMALQNLTRVPIPCPASELVKQGDVLTLRADAERHPKTNKKKKSAFLGSHFPSAIPVQVDDSS